MDVPDAKRLKALDDENTRLKKIVAEQALAIDGLKGDSRPKMVTPVDRRRAMHTLINRGLSQRVTCRYLDLSRRIACYALKQPAKDAALLTQLRATIQRYPRFGYRRVALMLVPDFPVSTKCVWRLWSQHHLALPRKRSRRRRCGSDIRLPQAQARNAVWCLDFVHDALANARKLKLLCVLGPAYP